MGFGKKLKKIGKQIKKNVKTVSKAAGKALKYATPVATGVLAATGVGTPLAIGLTAAGGTVGSSILSGGSKKKKLKTFKKVGTSTLIAGAGGLAVNAGLSALGALPSANNLFGIGAGAPGTVSANDIPYGPELPPDMSPGFFGGLSSALGSTANQLLGEGKSDLLKAFEGKLGLLQGPDQAPTGETAQEMENGRLGQSDARGGGLSTSTMLLIGGGVLLVILLAKR